MDKVNIIVATTCKGPGKQEAVGMWLIERIKDGIPETKDGFLERESITSKELTIQCLANAVYIISKANVEFDTVEVYLEEPIVASAFMNKWIDKWMANDWKNSKGEPVAHSEDWKKLYELMDSSSKRFIVTTHRSSYTDWMKMQADKHLEVIKAKRELREKLTGGN